MIDFSKLPIEVSGSSILARHSYVLKNPDITLNFSKPGSRGRIYLKLNPNLASVY